MNVLKNKLDKLIESRKGFLMAIYVTKKCPHCGYKYQTHQAGDQRKYGCPCQTCARCSGVYWDKDIKEPALYGYKNFHETKETILRGILLLFSGIIGVCFIVEGIFFIFETGEIIWIFELIVGSFFVWIIYSHFKQKKYDKQHKTDLILSQQKEYDASMKRMRDTNYLKALACFDLRARKLLDERENGMKENYAERPK